MAQVACWSALDCPVGCPSEAAAGRTHALAGGPPRGPLPGGAMHRLRTLKMFLARMLSTHAKHTVWLQGCRRERVQQQVDGQGARQAGR